MKYMIMMFGDQAGLQTQSSEWIKEMIAFMHTVNADLTASGELVAAEGLVDATQAKLVAFEDGLPVVSDGPFAESKESLAGYWIVDVESERRALAIAARVMAFIGPAGAPPLEVRRIGDAPPET